MARMELLGSMKKVAASKLDYFQVCSVIKHPHFHFLGGKWDKEEQLLPTDDWRQPEELICNDSCITLTWQKRNHRKDWKNEKTGKQNIQQQTIVQNDYKLPTNQTNGTSDMP